MIYPFYGPQSGLPGPDPFGGYDYPQYPLPPPGQWPGYYGLPQPFPTPFLPDSYEGEYTEQDSYDDIHQPILQEPMEEMPRLGDGLGMGIPSMMGMGEFGLGDPTGGLGGYSQSTETQLELAGEGGGASSSLDYGTDISLLEIRPKIDLDSQKKKKYRDKELDLDVEVETGDLTIWKNRARVGLIQYQIVRYKIYQPKKRTPISTISFAVSLNKKNKHLLKRIHYYQFYWWEAIPLDGNGQPLTDEQGPIRLTGQDRVGGSTGSHVKDDGGILTSTVKSTTNPNRPNVYVDSGTKGNPRYDSHKAAETKVDSEKLTIRVTDKPDWTGAVSEDSIRHAMDVFGDEYPTLQGLEIHVHFRMYVVVENGVPEIIACFEWDYSCKAWFNAEFQYRGPLELIELTGSKKPPIEFQPREKQALHNYGLKKG